MTADQVRGYALAVRDTIQDEAATPDHVFQGAVVVLLGEIAARLAELDMSISTKTFQNEVHVIVRKQDA